MMELWNRFDRLVMFDTETTGIAFGKDRIIEIGAVALERDGERARRLYAARPWLWSAPAAAGRICARMAASGERLSTLAGLVGEGSGG